MKKIKLYSILVLLFTIGCSSLNDKESNLKATQNACVSLRIKKTRLPNQFQETSNIHHLKVNRPTPGACKLSSLQTALVGVDRNLNRMKSGLSPDGSKVVAAITKDNSCNTETLACVPIVRPTEEFNPYISQEITDSCVKYCAIVHEWIHFNDTRPWSLSMTDSELAIHWEQSAYENERSCLMSFLNQTTN